MPPLAPIKRRDLIRKLRTFGFEGPYAGGKREYMVKIPSSCLSPTHTVARSVKAC